MEIHLARMPRCQHGWLAIPIIEILSNSSFDRITGLASRACFKLNLGFKIHFIKFIPQTKISGIFSHLEHIGYIIRQADGALK